MDQNQGAQQQTAKRSNKKLIIIIVGILLAICLIILIFAGIGGFFFYRSISAPVDPIKKQLSLINEGKNKEAYENYTSEAFKRETSFEEFNDIIEKNPQIFESKSSSFNNVRINGKQAVAKGTITGKDGTVTPMTYDLVLEKQKWLILGFRKGVSEEDS